MFTATFGPTALSVMQPYIDVEDYRGAWMHLQQYQADHFSVADPEVLIAKLDTISFDAGQQIAQYRSQFSDLVKAITRIEDIWLVLIYIWFRNGIQKRGSNEGYYEVFRNAEMLHRKMPAGERVNEIYGCLQDHERGLVASAATSRIRANTPEASVAAKQANLEGTPRSKLHDKNGEPPKKGMKFCDHPGCKRWTYHATAEHKTKAELAAANGDGNANKMLEALKQANSKIHGNQHSAHVATARAHLGDIMESEDDDSEEYENTDEDA